MIIKIYTLQNSILSKLKVKVIFNSRDAACKINSRGSEVSVYICSINFRKIHRETSVLESPSGCLFYWKSFLFNYEEIYTEMYNIEVVSIMDFRELN